MAAVLLPNNRIQVGASIYPKSIVSLHVSKFGIYLNASLSAYGQEIEMCSDDPAHPKYAVNMFGKTTVDGIAETAQNQNIVRVTGLSELENVVFERTINGNTFTYTKANHSFPVPSVVASTGTDWVLADKDNALDVFVIVSATTNTFTVGLPGCHEVNHQLGNAPGLFYLGDPPNNLTRTAAPVGQTPKKQLVLGQVLDLNHLWIQPEWRAT